MAVVVILSFALVFAIQAIVFLLALPIGLLIGWYANVRDRAALTLAADRKRGGGSPRMRRRRFLSNGFIAGLMTAVALAALYALIRLLFLYLDTGFRAGGPPYACSIGPECGYRRALEEPTVRAALEAAGVHDAAGYTAFFLEGQAVGAGTLFGLVIGGSMVVSAGFAIVWRTPGAGAPAGGQPQAESS